MAKKDVMIKDAPLVEVINGAEKIPVSDGSNEPRAVNLQQIKVFVGADTPLSKGQGENSVKQTPPSPTFEKKNEILADEKGEFIEADALGDYAVALGGTAAAIGKRSVAQGHRCIAEGETSHAEGNCAVVKYMDETLNGYGSHAEGYSTVVAGVYSHAEGSKTVVVGNNSHAEGGETGVSADMAHSEGYKTTVGTDGDGAHAEGNSTSANAKYSHTEGRQTKTLGEGAHAEGTETTAKKDYSHSEGKGTKSDGLYSHAEGIDSETNAAGSHAEGFETHANNECSHAEGHGAVAKGMYSHAEGWVTNAIGEASHAEGQNTRAHQIGSHAEGNNTDAKGAYSHAEGIGTKTKEGIAGQHVEGYYNKETDSLKIIGCGTSDEDRKNAVEITQDGRVFVKGIGNYDGTSLEAVDLKTALDHKANSGDVYNKTEMDNRIKADLVQKVEVATINGQSLTNGGNIVIEGSATPDWDAQGGEAGYIKNRTHYFNPTMTVSESSWSFDNSLYTKKATTTLEADWLYRFEWNGNIYYIKTDSRGNMTNLLVSGGSLKIYHKCEDGRHSLEFSRYGDAITRAPMEVRGTSIGAATSMGFLKPLDELFIPESIARKSELTELSEEVSGLSEKIENLPSAEEEVFIVEYNVTTYEQIVAAYNEGKQILCFYEGKAYHLTQLALQLADKDAYFTIVNNNYVYRLICSSGYGTWRRDQIQLENTANKVTTLSESSTDAQYPSAKAVYEALQNVGGSSVFWATYGETTFAEIIAAYNQKKEVLCKYQDRIARIVQVQDNVLVYFEVIVGSDAQGLVCYPSNVWNSTYISNAHKLEDLANGNAKITIAGQTAEVASGTPSGDPMHYMFEAVGATYNATDADIPMVGIYGDSYVHKAKHWHLNELGDITNEEMRVIYAERYPIPSAKYIYEWFREAKARTTLSALTQSATITTFTSGARGGLFETLCLRADNGEFVFSGNVDSAFYGNKKLKKILTILDVTALSTLSAPFGGCDILEGVLLKGLKVSYSFKFNLINTSSVLYMIQNEAATSPITITLHASGYDKAMADADIQAALAAHPNVTLAK